MRAALGQFGKPWKENPKDGAFYGPKIDIILFDAMKRSHQCGTIQLDFQAAIRFNLLYKSDQDTVVEESNSGLSKHSENDTAVKNYYEFPPDEFDHEVFKWEEHEPKPGFKRPVIIHRAILGSIERFYSILIEHIDGKWPFWLSPKQVAVLPVSEKFQGYAEKVHLAMQREGFHSMVDSTNATINKKIRNAQLSQWNYMLVVGQDEMDLGMVNIRSREGNIIGLKRVDEAIAMFKEEKAPVAKKELEIYSNVWKSEDFPFDEAKYQALLAKEAEKADKYKKQQEEKQMKAKEDNGVDTQSGKKGNKQENSKKKDSKLEDSKKEE